MKRLTSKKKLKRAIVDIIEEPKEDIIKPTIQQLLVDIRLNSPNIATAAKVHLKKEFGISEIPDHFFIKMHQIDEEDFRSETNIGSIFNFDEMTVHKVIERALLSVAGLNQRIAEMKAFSALSGFQVDDIPIFSEKLDFIGKQFCPAAKEREMKRVIELAGFPDFSKIGEGYTLDIDKFLKIRESDECKRFRKWLSESPSLTDKEVEELFSSIRTKIGSALGGTFGKSLRFLVSTGIGSLDGGAISGPVIGAIDTFILEKIFPASGVVSFVNRHYPSIFKVN